MPPFNKLHALADAIPERGQELLDAYQAYGVSAVQQLAPVDTGNLKNSVGPAPGDDQDSRKVVVGANYGIYQEMGTMDMPAQPFVRPGFAALRAPFQRDVKAILKP